MDKQTVTSNLYPNPKFTGKQKGCYKIWEPREDIIFLDFLETHAHHFETLACKRSNKVFIQMEKLFVDRTSQHCKSHYQKLQKMAQSKDVKNVIKYMIKKLYKGKRSRKKFLTS